jgi:hypothetical protein
MTEVYSAKDGQPLKQGKLDYSSIEDKGEAEADAKRRCQRDPTIKKVAYYTTSADGSFRILYSYTNPNCKPAGQAKPAAAAAPKKRTPKPPPKLGFFAKLAKALGLG